MTESEPAESERSDALTIGAIAVFAYVITSVLHEGLGHGGACYITGGKVKLISTVAAECSVENQLVIAGGAADECGSGHRLPLSRAPYRFASGKASVLLLADDGGQPLHGFGIFSVLRHRRLRRLVAVHPGIPTAVGMARRDDDLRRRGLRVVGTVSPARTATSSDPQERILRAARLSKISYFTGGVLACIAAALNPDGFVLVALSAAASTFGGTSGLLWTLDWLKGDRIPRGSFEEPVPIRRNIAWIVAAAVLAAAFIGLVGPGVRFH